LNEMANVPAVEPAGSLTVTNCTSTFGATPASPPASGFTVLEAPTICGSAEAAIDPPKVIV
jgi:hypothetical protein